MRYIKLIIFLFFGMLMIVNGQESKTPVIKKKPDLVLVFTKTEGYRHESIASGVKALRELGRKNNFIVIRTEGGQDFSIKNLINYGLVVFLNTTGDVLDNDQQKDFEKYIKSGGSYLGIHAAADTEYEWDWYGKLVGGYFESHPNDPNVLEAKINILNNSHSSTAHLNKTWMRNDEWYNYKNLNSNITVVMNLDEKSYEGGTNGDKHPIAWYHEYDGGRAYYTGGGHTNLSFNESDFNKHLLGAIEWCLKR